MAICKLCGKELKGVNSEYQHYPGVHNMKFSRKTGELTPMGPTKAKSQTHYEPRQLTSSTASIEEVSTKQALSLLVSKGIMTQEQANVTLKTLMPSSTPTFNFSPIIDGKPIRTEIHTPAPEPEVRASSKIRPHPVRNVDDQFAFNEEASKAELTKKSNHTTDALLKMAHRVNLAINERVYEQIDQRAYIVDLMSSIFEGQIAITDGQLHYYNGKTIVSEAFTPALAAMIVTRTLEYLDLLLSIDLSQEHTNNILGKGNYSNLTLIHQRLSNLSGLSTYVRKNGISPESLETKAFQVVLKPPAPVRREIEEIEIVE